MATRGVLEPSATLKCICRATAASLKQFSPHGESGTARALRFVCVRETTRGESSLSDPARAATSDFCKTVAIVCKGLVFWPRDRVGLKGPGQDDLRLMCLLRYSRMQSTNSFAKV
jgi:hypothetical protein